MNISKANGLIPNIANKRTKVKNPIAIKISAPIKITNAFKTNKKIRAISSPKRSNLVLFITILTLSVSPLIFFLWKQSLLVHLSFLAYRKYLWLPGQ